MIANSLEIYLVSSSFKGSSGLGSYKMRGLETIEILRRMYQPKFIPISLKDVLDLPKESSSKRIFVIIKPYKKDFRYYKHIHHYLTGVIILDFIDSIYLKRSCLWIKDNPNVISALILPNLDAKNFVDMLGVTIPSTVIYHHAHSPTEIQKQTELSFCYLGKPGCNHSSCPSIQCFSFSEENLNKASTYWCHTSYRITKKFKPNTKISIAANCESNIVINKTSGGVESLPNEYTYICDDTEESFLEMMDKVTQEFESREWYSNLDIMKWYKNEYSIENISKTYYNFITSVV